MNANDFVTQVRTGWASAHRLPPAYVVMPVSEKRAFLKALREAGLIQRPDKLWEAPPEVVDAAIEAQRASAENAPGKGRFAGRTLTVSRLAGDYSASLCLDDEDRTELHSAGLGDKSALMREIADRWNGHAELLAFVRQVARTEVNTLSLDLAPEAARKLLARLGC